MTCEFSKTTSRSSFGFPKGVYLSLLQDEFIDKFGGFNSCIIPVLGKLKTSKSLLFCEYKVMRLSPSIVKIFKYSGSYWIILSV